MSLKKAIIVLTRGYNNLINYKQLINRNINIDKYLKDKNIDIIIFNEGNITLEHQIYIKKFTPILNIIFINIKEKNKAFLEDKKNIKFYKNTERWGLSYRHMCSFWFVNFWDYCDEYDYILRIDEDCIIYFNIDNIFNILEKEMKVCIYGSQINDLNIVTFGLNNFTLQFLKYYLPNKVFKPKNPYGPYTNVFFLNLKLLRENFLLKKYIKCIEKSNFIYIYRWGDLPLWGEILYYLYDNNKYLVTNNIKYYHGSHNKKVNF